MPQHETPSEAEQRRARARATSIVHVIERNQTAAQKHKTWERQLAELNKSKENQEREHSLTVMKRHEELHRRISARIAQQQNLESKQRVELHRQLDMKEKKFQTEQEREASEIMRRTEAIERKAKASRESRRQLGETAEAMAMTKLERQQQQLQESADRLEAHRKATEASLAAKNKAWLAKRSEVQGRLDEAARQREERDKEWARQSLSHSQQLSRSFDARQREAMRRATQAHQALSQTASSFNDLVKREQKFRKNKMEMGMRQSADYARQVRQEEQRRRAELAASRRARSLAHLQDKAETDGQHEEHMRQNYDNIEKRCEEVITARQQRKKAQRERAQVVLRANMTMSALVGEALVHNYSVDELKSKLASQVKGLPSLV